MDNAKSQHKDSKQVPIASLNPNEPLLEASHIQAIVSLIWPYSVSHQSAALLLVEPDFRLRSKRGQVRVRLQGPAARAVNQCNIAIGDSLELSVLDGIWVEATHVKTPGRSVEGELVFAERLALVIHRNGALVARLDIDEPRSPAQSPSAAIQVQTSAQVLARPIYSTPSGPAEPASFESPLKLKWSPYNLFGDSFGDDYSLEERPKKRIRTSGLWRYERRLDTPEVQTPPDRVAMASREGVEHFDTHEDAAAGQNVSTQTSNKDHSRQKSDIALSVQQQQIENSQSRSISDPEYFQTNESGQDPYVPQLDQTLEVTSPRLRIVEPTISPSASPLPALRATGNRDVDFSSSPAIEHVHEDAAFERSSLPLTKSINAPENLELLPHQRLHPDLELDDFKSSRKQQDEMTSQPYSQKRTSDTSGSVSPVSDCGLETHDSSRTGNRVISGDLASSQAQGLYDETSSVGDEAKSISGAIVADDDISTKDAEGQFIAPTLVSASHMADSGPPKFQGSGMGDSTPRPLPAPPTVQHALPNSSSFISMLERTPTPPSSTEYGTSLSKRREFKIVEPSTDDEDENQPPESSSADVLGLKSEQDLDHELHNSMPSPSCAPRGVSRDSGRFPNSSPPRLPSPIAPANSNLSSPGANTARPRRMTSHSTPTRVEVDIHQSSSFSPTPQPSPREASRYSTNETGRRPLGLLLSQQSVGYSDFSASQRTNRTDGTFVPDSESDATNLEAIASEQGYPRIQAPLDTWDDAERQLEGRSGERESSSAADRGRESQMTEEDMRAEWSVDEAFYIPTSPNTWRYNEDREPQSPSSPHRAMRKTQPPISGNEVVVESLADHDAVLQSITSIVPEIPKRESRDDRRDEIVSAQDSQVSPSNLVALQRDVVASQAKVLPPSNFAVRALTPPPTFRLSQINAQSPSTIAKVITPRASQDTITLTQSSPFFGHRVDQILDDRAPLTPQPSGISRRLIEEAASALENRIQTMSQEQPQKDLSPPQDANIAAREISSRESIVDTSKSSKRHSEVPDVISKWFSSGRRASNNRSSIRSATLNKEMLSLTPTASARRDVGFSFHASTTANPRGAKVDQGDSTDASDLLTTSIKRKGEESYGIRTSISYYTPLSGLERHMNGPSQSIQDTIDLIVVAISPNSEAKRAKSGPKDYHTVFKVCDKSSVPERTQVQVFRPFKQSLPVVSTGDVILLRNFIVKSTFRTCFLLSGEASAWHVWHFSKQARDLAGGGRAPLAQQKKGPEQELQECRGPPVEVGDEEQDHAFALGSWWESTQFSILEESAASHELRDEDGQHSLINDVAFEAAPMAAE